MFRSVHGFYSQTEGGIERIEALLCGPKLANSFWAKHVLSANIKLCNFFGIVRHDHSLPPIVLLKSAGETGRAKRPVLRLNKMIIEDDILRPPL